MTSLVPSRLSPLRDSALEGPATGSTVGWDMIGTVLALIETDIEKLLFYSTFFSSARGTALCDQNSFPVCLACVDVPACWVFVY